MKTNLLLTLFLVLSASAVAEEVAEGSADYQTCSNNLQACTEGQGPCYSKYLKCVATAKGPGADVGRGVAASAPGEMAPNPPQSEGAGDIVERDLLAADARYPAQSPAPSAAPSIAPSIAPSTDPSASPSASVSPSTSPAASLPPIPLPTVVNDNT